MNATRNAQLEMTSPARKPAEAAAYPTSGFRSLDTQRFPQALWPEPVPDYLEKNYWWAYRHPRGVKFFDREWMVNLILFGNMAKLRQDWNAAIECYRRSVALRPDSVAARTNLGGSLRNAGLDAEAIERLDRLVGATGGVSDLGDKL